MCPGDSSDKPILTQAGPQSSPPAQNRGLWSAQSVGRLSNLVLTGFMGTGKTVVGRELARRLGREFVDMDAEIEARAGLSIRRLFAGAGEAAFREWEAALCRELAARSGLVIATGGGALLSQVNWEILSASGQVVCLSATPDEILRRLETTGDRPLLDSADRKARIAALLAERADAYSRIPLQVDTTGLAVAQVADRVLSLAEQVSSATVIPVRYPGGEYPLHLGRGLLAQIGPLLRQQGFDGQVAVVTNPTVGQFYQAPVVASLEGAGYATTVCTVPDGEQYKHLATVEVLYEWFIDAGLDRRSAVLALGGGVIGDMAGFAAATFLRGVPLVQVPTTLLAMVDASVGGKVAVDHGRGKNLIGAFKQPELVVADPDVLATLPRAELDNGLAETIKAGLIADPLLFEQIEAHGPAPLPWLIERAVRVKVAVVEADPYEQGRRAVLNLGHTFGHALEVLSGYQRGVGGRGAAGLPAGPV
jgi:shikimate kinase/3-dehydroquinate synthase